MRVTTLASGSTGNCTLLQTDSGSLLIDAGISARRITQGLNQLGDDARNLSAILITHEHTDHISGLAVLLKRTAAPVYALPAVAGCLTSMIPERAAQIHPVRETFELGDFSISPIPTLHDSADSCGWRVETEDDTFGLCTDLGVVTEEVLDGLCGVSCALIESNHDVNMLLCGPYPPYLKKRILSDHGHLSNAASAELAATLAANGTEHLILGHLSRHNNTPAKALETVCGYLEACLPEILRPTVNCAPERDFLTVEIGGYTPCML